MGSSSSFRLFGTSSSAMHRLRKSLWDLYFTALSLSRFSFSAICSLFFLMIPVVVNSALFHYSLPQLVLMLKFDPLVLLELAHLVFFWMVFCYFLLLRLFSLCIKEYCWLNCWYKLAKWISRFSNEKRNFFHKSFDKSCVNIIMEEFFFWKCTLYWNGCYFSSRNIKKFVLKTGSFFRKFLTKSWWKHE